MIDEKDLDQMLEHAEIKYSHYASSISGPSKAVQDEGMRRAREAIRLAKLGLWAEQYGVPAAKFYGTFSPRQHPEGFYEIHVAPGEGGEVRFGTRARSALANLPSERGGV